MKYSTRIISCMAILGIFMQVQKSLAQDPAVVITRSIQFGFITPLGTNGLDSWNVSNKFSVNLLAGYAAGVDGIEFSGLGSVLQKDMTGAQFAGLGSVVLKNIRGVQFSGLYNIGLGSVTGAQFAGLVNYNMGPVKGFQTAGLANIHTDTTTGFQLSGLINYAPGIKVTQVSGLANVTSGNNKGLQMAGFANINPGRLSGTQVAGLFNYTGVLRGVQFGMFNYTDSLESGVPIGFLSFVRGGYTSVEIGATETLFGVMSFKTGIRQFYNILSVGGGSFDGSSLFAWGYGAGAFIPLGQKAGLSIDGICYQVNKGEWFTNHLSLLNKLNITASWIVAKHFSLYGGISWNVTVVDYTDEYGDPVDGYSFAPWYVFNENYNDHLNVKMYPGISAGIRL